MRKSLRARVLPALRQSGFSGDFPHFRRQTTTHFEFVTFQFNKYGGSFIIELGQWPIAQPVPDDAAGMPFAKLNSWCLPLAARARLSPALRDRPQRWFSYKPTLFGRSDARFDRAAKDLLGKLPEVLAWFLGARPQPHIRELVYDTFFKKPVDAVVA